jgi:hypothetical protein
MKKQTPSYRGYRFPFFLTFHDARQGRSGWYEKRGRINVFGLV